MKPLCLKVSGLHSFRDEQEIRFDTLSDLGVFGIFGPTGSGKSSILDAMTLALYGTVVRAKNNKQGIINHAEKTLAVSFKFALGTAPNRKIYRVERSYKTKDHLSVANVQSRLIETIDDTDVVVAEKDGEVTAHITQLLGLTPDDFTRAVVLPQGRFAEFLTLNSKDRRQMLERLFSLEQYGKGLEEKLKTRLNEASSSRDQLEGEQKGLGDASSVVLQKSEETLVQVKAAELIADQQLQSIKESYEQAKKIYNLQLELNNKEQEFERHKEQQSEIEKIVNEICLAEKAMIILPVIEERNKLAMEEATGQVTCRRACQETLRLKKMAEGLQVQYDLAHKERVENEPKLIVRMTQLESARKMEDEVSVLQGIIDQVRQEYMEQIQQQQQIVISIRDDSNILAQLTETIRKDQIELNQNTVETEHRAQIQDGMQKANAVEREMQILLKEKKSVKDRQNELAKIRADQVNAEQILLKNEQEVLLVEHGEDEALKQSLVNEETLAQVDVRLAGMKIQVNQLRELESKIDSESKLITTLQTSLHTSKQMQVEAVKIYQDNKEKLEFLNKKLTEFILSDKKVLAAKLAAELEEGQTCPVCGALDHPCVAVAFDEVEDSSSHKDDLKKEIEETKLRADTAEAELRKIADRIISEQTRLESVLANSNVLSDSIEAIRSVLADELGEDASGRPFTNFFLNLIITQESYIRGQKDNLKTWREARKKAEDILKKLRQQAADAKSKVIGEQQKGDSKEQELARANIELAETEKRLSVDIDLLANVLQKLGITIQDIGITGVQCIRKLATEVTEKDQYAEQLRIKLDRLRQEASSSQVKVDNLQKIEQQLRVELSGLQSRIESEERIVKDKWSQLNEITEGIPVKGLLSQVEDNLFQIKQTEKDTKNTYDENNIACVKAEQEQAKAEAQLSNLVERLQQVNEKLIDQLKEKGFSSADEVGEAAIEPTELQVKRNKINTYRDYEKRLSAQCDQIVSNLGGKRILPQEWIDIQQELAQAIDETNKIIERRIVADKEYRDLQAKHQRWAKLEIQLADVRVELGHLQMLKNLLKGNMFVEFLAQEQMELVLQYASERLKQLTRNRYALEIDSDGGFMIRDDANGGVRRPVATLSGGETFQTSLALALALSTQIQLRGKHPLEFFFLDEGFGSLDQSSLDMVISTLETLHLERMTIGIISHVAELQQRMPRRLIVEPAESAGKGSQVWIEIA
ncbi:AAA family ATPase [Pelosinus sp. sgz500959]|uniref:AAA family ATPase n=1 Tax=Pelosinus sp. sgz500959 TaxID=3242472 RepID=UPI003672EB2C